MHKVKKPNQRYLAQLKTGITVWQQWASLYPDDKLKQFTAQMCILACRRQITEKELFTRLADKEGLFEASEEWLDVPVWR